jgi:DNA-directed RNA polymerase subunit RPC12/RpoP
MSYLVYSIAEIAFIIILGIVLSKKTKMITCKNCNQEFGVIPQKTIIIVSFLVFCQMSLVNIFIYGKGLSFMCYLAGITAIYNLFKKEGYKCVNCKTINQLP